MIIVFSAQTSLLCARFDIAPWLAGMRYFRTMTKVKACESATLRFAVNGPHEKTADRLASTAGHRSGLILHQDTNATLGNIQNTVVILSARKRVLSAVQWQRNTHVKQLVMMKHRDADDVTSLASMLLTPVREGRLER